MIDHQALPTTNAELLLASRYLLTPGPFQMGAALAYLARLDSAQGGNVGEVAAAVAKRMGVELEAVKGLIRQEFTCLLKRIEDIQVSLKLQAESQAAMRDMLMDIRQTLPYLHLQRVTHPSWPCYSPGAGLS